MSDNDALIREILSRYGEDFAASVWRVQGQAVIYHKALERIAVKAGIVLDPPVMLRCERDEAVILVTGRSGSDLERYDWSIGEALVGVNYRVSGKQAAYVYAMAEKRARDRVTLKLVGLHGLLYSEDEADAFSRPAQQEAKQEAKQEAEQEAKQEAKQEASIAISSGTGENRKSAYAARKDGRWAPIVGKLRACKTAEQLAQWAEEHTEDVKTLPEHWVAELRDEYAAIAYGIAKGR